MTDVRIHLTDKEIVRLSPPETGWYLARDTELKGFFLVVGKRKKTFTIQGDLRHQGIRRSIRVAIGEAGEISTREARNVGRAYLSMIAKGEHPSPRIVQSPHVEVVRALTQTTLRNAWTRYRGAHLVRKGRSDKTVHGYRDHVERVFSAWLDVPLTELGNDPSRIVQEHERISQTHGPYLANGAMRTLRAIYNHARKSDRSLPADNPVNAIDWNGETRRDTAMGLADLEKWFLQLAALSNPIRREFHLLTLLSGSRPDALRQVRLENLDRTRRVMHIPKPKGGSKKSFDIPLSREMIRSIVRARRAGMCMHPEAAAQWLFPATSSTGYIGEQKENRSVLSKWGNDLRQSFRTLAQVAGISEFDARLLMNHSLPGVNAGYITRNKLLQDHLRQQQEAISCLIMRPARKMAGSPGRVRDWLTWRG